MATQLQTEPGTEENAPLISMLRGEMLKRTVASLRTQDNLLNYDQTIKLSGSSVIYLHAEDEKNIKVPGDIDLAVCTDSGLRPNHGWPEETVKRLIYQTTQANGYEFTPISSMSGSEHCAYITRHFSPEEVRGIARAAGNEEDLARNGISLDALDAPIKVVLPVHFVHNPINYLPPVRDELGGEQQQGKLRPFLRDNIVDIFSVKLARAMLDDEGKGIHASDIMDLNAMLSVPAMREEVMKDPELVRVLAVAVMAERVTPETLDKVQFAFPEDGDTLGQFGAALRKKGMLVPEDATIRAALERVNEAINQIFPERGGHRMTEGETEFLQHAAAPDQEKGATDNIDMSLLTKGKEDNVFARYPKLENNIHYSSSLGDALEDRGAMRFWH